MNYVRLTLAVTAAFFFVFVFEFIYHGILLKPLYEATMNLWRPQDQMMTLMPVALIVQFVFAFIAVVMFAAFAKESGVKQGVRFGALLGLMLGTLQLGIFPYLPIPAELALGWFAGAFIETLGVGVIAGLIYKSA